MAEGAGPPGLLAIIAGRGALPRQIVEARQAAGLPYLLIVFPDCFEDWMSNHPHARHVFEKAGAVFRALRNAGATHVVFAGAMNRPKLRPWKMDLKSLGLLAKATRLLRKGDDGMLRGFASIFEDEGLTMIGPMDVLGADLTIAPGLYCGATPSEQAMADARLAAAIVKALGPLDVGQGAVVANGICLAVEAIEGTDLMLARVASLPTERRRQAPPVSGVLYKGPKPGQDLRMDLPTIGPGTVEAVATAGLSGIVVAAGRTLIADAVTARDLAQEKGIFIYGASEAELGTSE